MPALIATPAPPKVVGPTNKQPIKPTQALPRYIIDEGLQYERIEFDVSKHLNIAQPSKIYKMKDIGREGEGISETATTEPFSLFTPEAIKQIRSELFSPPVLADHQYSSAFATNMIRGYGPK